ncbi:hypothetical protein Angca_001629 [Angiostrongylus cantonensis]|nr:hypothetical protein Angca_001629 [Angiostrongylus cantonensis]
MSEEILCDVLPVIGFAACASSCLVMVVMRKSTSALRFIIWFSLIDLLAGSATIYGGFYEIVSTFYGKTRDVMSPIKCTLIAFHITVWLFLDVYHLAVLSLLCFDRLLLMLIPVVYVKISRIYLHWIFILSLGLVTCIAIGPAFSLPIESFQNQSILVPPLCHLDSVIGENYYNGHLKAMQWMPISGIGVILLSILVYRIRSLKQKWSFNCSESTEHHKQLYIACFLRCLLLGISVHLPLLFIYSVPGYRHLEEIRDILIRMLYALLVVLPQPLWYMLSMPDFAKNASLLFNQYGHRTERKWQSADDPPQNAQHLDPHGEFNPFGSWFSSTGSILGNFGVPVGDKVYTTPDLIMKKTRSVSGANDMISL